MMTETAGKLNKITGVIITSAIAVHRKLGPGLLESTYEVCLVHELSRRGLSVERQKLLPVHYGDVAIDAAYRVDLLVSEQVVVELKAVDRVDPIHLMQLLTYLKLSGCRVGLLINFNVRMLRNGIRRMVHGFPG